MTKKHSQFGSPSSLYRHEKCPASVAYCKDLPDVIAGPDSLDGTLFHDCMEQAAPYYIKNNAFLVKVLDKAKDDDMRIVIRDTLEKLKASQSESLILV